MYSYKRESGIADLVYDLYKTYPDAIDFNEAQELLGETTVMLRRTLAYIFISHVSNNYSSLQEVQETFGFPRKVLINMTTDTEINFPYYDITHTYEAENICHKKGPASEPKEHYKEPYSAEPDNIRFSEVIMEHLEPNSIEEIIGFPDKKNK